MGGILIALRIKGEGEAEMRGFYEAMQSQTMRLTPPVTKPMPMVIPTYNGARKQANPHAAAGYSVAETRFPGGGAWRERRSNARADRDHSGIIRHRTYSPCWPGAGRSWRGTSRSIFPVRALCPPLEKQLDMRWRMGVRNSAHTLAKLATPFAEDAALRLSSVSHPEYVTRVGQFLPKSAGERC